MEKGCHRIQERERLRIHVVDLYKSHFFVTVVQGVVNLLLYAVLAWISLVWKPLSFVTWPLMGLILAGFLAAGHDCVHGKISNPKRRIVNRIAGIAWCTPIFVNYTAFKWAHLTHHRLTRVLGDPESAEPLRSISEYFRQVVIGHPLRPMKASISVLFGVFPRHIQSLSQKKGARLDSIIIVLWLILMGILTLKYSHLLISIYWGPVLFFNTMVSLIALPEHYNCGVGPRVIPSTRSVTSNALVRFVLWNGNFHVEHHLYPAIPSCNLSELSRRLNNTSIIRANSYTRFHVSLLRDLSHRSLTLK